MNSIEPLTVAIAIAIAIAANIFLIIWRFYFQKCRSVAENLEKLAINIL